MTAHEISNNLIVTKHRKSPQPRINAGIVGFTLLFELGVSFAVLNYIYLSFMQIHATFYFNYINYSCLLIFCCQNVATQFYNKIIAISFLLSHLLFPPPFLELYFLLLYLLVKGYNQ